MRLGGDMGPNMGTTINKIAYATHGRKLNSTSHTCFSMYVNVEGRSKTELTFLLQELEYYLYNCYDIYGSTSDEEAGDQEDKGTKQDPLQESLRKERKNLNMGGSKGRRNVGDYLGFGHDEKPGLRTMRRKVRQDSAGSYVDKETVSISSLDKMVG
ncbi:hypothetical protein E2C01_060984 [Portunus trituberculatus]|uniref:Uncharacterized protein n=1 Tax=Portunus trituberculatus TaxID=210409 RepID=A0A5B7HAJ0_PORTR|nr:hypothetical protein [Portunus trituberculatus]